MKLISIVSPCYNEEENIKELYNQVKAITESIEGYQYEFLFIDNASTDKTSEILRELAANDQRVKVIINNRNFGHIRSPYHGIMQASGEAVVYLASDLQDPPHLIPDFMKKWEEGNKVVLAVKSKSEETPLMYFLRSLYYNLISKLSDSNVELVKNSTGFGLYDKKVIDEIRKINDPYPYLRGLICELGFQTALIEFNQPSRKRGITKNNFYTLYDIAMLGFTSYSKVPLRLAAMSGFLLSLLSLIVAIGYLVYKLLMWESFSVGMAPIVIGLFFFASVQLFFIGILGEYIGAIHTQVLNRPIVVEKERINF